MIDVTCPVPKLQEKRLVKNHFSLSSSIIIFSTTRLDGIFLLVLRTFLGLNNFLSRLDV